MTTWDGKERRTPMGDHDLLQQIANDVKHLVGWTKEHKQEDDARYNQLNGESKNVQRVLWLAGGVVLAFQVILKFIK